MLAKSVLHWPLARARETHDDREPIVPENVYNLLDAQAFIPDNSEGFSKRVGARAFWKQSVISNGPPRARNPFSDDQKLRWARTCSKTVS